LPTKRSQRIEEVEKKYDAQFRAVLDAIRELLQPVPGKILTPIESHGSRGGLNSFGPPGLGKTAGRRQQAAGRRMKCDG